MAVAFRELCYTLLAQRVKFCLLWLVLASLTFVIAACQPTRSQAVSIGFAPSLNYVLIVALEQGYFADEGLKVTAKHYRTGKRVLHDGVLTEEVDVGIVGMGPLATESIDRQDITIFGSISTHYDLYKIVARRDSGIFVPSDLLGKRIATSRSSSFHFFLNNFMTEHQMQLDPNDVVFRQAADLPNVLARGEVDAISTREPFVTQARALLGENVIVFSEPSLPSNTLNAVSMRSFLNDNSEISTKLLRALIRSEEFIEKNSSEAQSIVADYLGVEPEELVEGWSNTEIGIGLDDDLILRLEQIARWVINNDSVEQRDVPNFLEQIYMTALDEISPASVSISRQILK